MKFLVVVTPPSIYQHPSRQGGKKCILAPYVLSNTVFVKIPLVFREGLRLRYYPRDLTQRMNEDKLHYLW